MTGVRIVTDSASDLPQDVVDRLGIAVVPLTIRFGDEEFVDREELSAEQFYERMEASEELPATAAPSPGKFAAAFRRLKDEGADSIVCIDMSEELSATIQSARTAAKEVEGMVDVVVVDSKSITSGLAVQVIEAAEMAADGRTPDDIVARCADLASRTRIFGGLDTLENLKKGGRIGGAQAMIGGLLSIKPIVDISTGRVEEAAKLRTRKKEMLWLRDKVFAAGDVEHLALPHGYAPDYDEYVALFADRYGPGDFTTSIIGATIGAHGGPRIVGASWIVPEGATE
jgi:DegV family protein with EDD domain